MVHDDYRIDYLGAHIKEMIKAVDEDGVDLMGYTPWVVSTLSQQVRVKCVNVMVSFTLIKMMKVTAHTNVHQNCHLTGTKVIASNGEEV